MTTVYSTDAFKIDLSDAPNDQYTSSCMIVQHDSGQFLVTQVDYFVNPVKGKTPWTNYTPCFTVHTEAEAIKKADTAFSTMPQ